MLLDGRWWVWCFFKLFCQYSALQLEPLKHIFKFKIIYLAPFTISLHQRSQSMQL